MIKFFRHIRKTLLEQNKMGKYFKYAIGEIILVVIGILIALQINNWNEERKIRNNEKNILIDIIEDLKLDYDAFKLQNKYLSIQIKIIDLLILNQDSSSLETGNLDIDYFRYNVDITPLTLDNNIPDGIYNKNIIELLKGYYRKQQLVLSDHYDHSIVVKDILRPYLREKNIHNPKSSLRNLADTNLELLNVKKLKQLCGKEYFGQILFEHKIKAVELNTSLSELLVLNEQLVPRIQSYVKD